MRVDAKGLIMISQIKRTPNSFITKHVKIVIEEVVVNRLDFDILLRVCERAELAILALGDLVRELRAEFSLVVVWVVELLYLVVRKFAVLAVRTFFFLLVFLLAFWIGFTFLMNLQISKE